MNTHTYEIQDGVLVRVPIASAAPSAAPKVAERDAPRERRPAKDAASLRKALSQAFASGQARPEEPAFRAPGQALADALRDLGWRGEGDLLRASRQEMYARCAPADPGQFRKLFHAWHVAAMSEKVERQSTRFLAVSFLPSSRGAAFDPQPALVRLAHGEGRTPADLVEGLNRQEDDSRLLVHETTADLLATMGHSWTALDEARVVVLFRGKGAGPGTWSLRVLSFWLDPDTFQLRAGGTQRHCDGTLRSHLLLTVPFGTGADLGLDRRPLSWVAPTHQLGLDLAFATELACYNREGVSRVLDWPRPWIGFAVDDAFTIEFTDGLVQDALRYLRVWNARQRPPQPSWLDAARLRSVLAARIDDWEDVIGSVGESMARNILESVWYETSVQHDGLRYVPLDYFQPGSAQRPLDGSRARRLVLSFGPAVMGRDLPLCGGVDPFQARTQVLGLSRTQTLRDVMLGDTPAVSWDFRTTRESRV